MIRTVSLLLPLITSFALSAYEACAGDESPSLEFTTDVMPILSKAGCNLGTCHGNLNGKGGLKLSLRGQDAEFDFRALVLAGKGRRANVISPESSLFLRKASGRISHGGGTRFDEDSQAYKLLIQWLTSGAPGPSDTAPTLLRLEVQPSQAIVIAPENKVQVHVTAYFSDGQSRDVTDTACYEMANLNASVSKHGVVTRDKYGETTLIVRYLQKQLPIAIAFTEARPDFKWSDPKEFNDIDKHVFAKLQRLRINPSALCSDSVFVRRAYLDAIGRIPTAEEAKQFVNDPSPARRSELIDHLMTQPEFSDFWALKWADVLRTEEKVLDTRGVEVFHGWIRDGIAAGRPLDQFVRDLVTGTGSTFENPPANYYRANRDPSTRGETTARLFLGTRLQCAKCHNHPFDRWTQDDYYQWSSLFSQLDYKVGDGKRQDKFDKNEMVGDQTVLVKKTDEIRNPATGKTAAPRFLGASELDENQRKDRLAALAIWLTSPGNELFVQSQVNFIWYQLMGKGLVDPIDDFRLTNPPSNPPLMEFLANKFTSGGFRLRDLVSTIMKSRTYQLSAIPNSTNVNDATSFSRAYVRRLSAEVILDMQSDVLGKPAEFLGYPNGIRAVQIPGANSKQLRRSSPRSGDRFLKTFGKPDRILACDCERSNETTLKQVFALIGEALSERLSESDNQIAQLALSKRTSSEIIDFLYWTALARPPSDLESARATKILEESGPDRRPAVEDIAWALLNAKEFVFRK